MDMWRGAHQAQARSDGSAHDALLTEVLRAARALLALQERRSVLARGAEAAPPSLSDAVERDFLGFEMQDAMAALREAVLAVDASAPPPG